MNKNNEKLSVLALIRSNLQSLSDSENKVAKWILLHPDQVLSLSMAQISYECGVSDTTVLRLCRNIGLKGFTDLKISVAQDIVNPAQLIHDNIKADDDSMAIARKVFQSNIQALYDTLELMNRDSLDKAVALIEKSKKILITGVGGSTPVVTEAFQRFMRIGLPVFSPMDIHFQTMQAALLGKGDLIITVSYSGMTIDPAVVTQEGRSHGASIIVLTSNPQSKLAEMADVILVAVTHEIRTDAIAARVAMASVIDTLSVILSLRHLDKVLEIEKKISNSIISKTF